MLCGHNSHAPDCCLFDMLEILYGPRPYKCEYLACPFRRHGFPTRTLQRAHTRSHSKPWKCSVAGCEYSEIGFLSRRMQNDHLDRYHREEQVADLNIPSTPGDASLSEMHDLIFDLVKLDQVEQVAALYTRFQTNLDSQRDQAYHHYQKKILGPLIQLAAFSPSVAMMQTLLEGKVETSWSSGVLKEDWLFALYAAVQANNVGIVQWILLNKDVGFPHEPRYPTSHDYTTGTSWRSFIGWAEILHAVLESDSEEVFQVFQQRLLEEFSMERAKERQTPPWERALARKVITAPAGQTDRERRLLSIWDSLFKSRNWGNRGRKPRQKTYLGAALVDIASSCLSVPMAKAMLGYGAYVDHRRSKIYRTPLQHTLRRSSLQSAQMTRFLLYHGASPTAELWGINGKRREKRGLTVAEEEGAREISKWLGMTWEELVDQVALDRAAGICPPEYA